MELSAAHNAELGLINPNKKIIIFDAQKGMAVHEVDFRTGEVNNNSLIPAQVEVQMAKN